MTTAKPKRGKAFYGWWVVLATGIGLLLGNTPIIVATFGVFLKSLSQEFAWSRTQISLAFFLSTDCISFVLMRTLRITRAFSFDRHFAHAGFTLWPEER